MQYGETSRMIRVLVTTTHYSSWRWLSRE